MNSIRNTDSRHPAHRDASVGWGAAIIDEQGNEVPITESMIERACDELARSWQFPRMPQVAPAR
ncbi:MAG: PA1571 family protein [Pseudomonadota bacterium]